MSTFSIGPHNFHKEVSVGVTINNDPPIMRIKSSCAGVLKTTDNGSGKEALLVGLFDAIVPTKIMLLLGVRQENHRLGEPLYHLHLGPGHFEFHGVSPIFVDR